MKTTQLVTAWAGFDVQVGI